MPYSIMLDAGHGGSDPGAVYNGRQEKDDTLRLVLAIGEILQNNDIDVEYTRTTDVYETPYQKAMEANEAGVDFFVSIHRNSSPMPNQYSGVESLVYDLSGIKYEMAQNINAQLETVGFVNLGVKARPNLVVLRRTRMPAVLVEVGFINSDTDNLLFDNNFNDIAQAIADGILDTLNVGAVEDEMHYRVQVGAFRNSTYANRLLQELIEMDFPAYIDDSGQYDRVQVGDYMTLAEAVQMEQRLKRAGYPTVIVSMT
ncbi:N-acetylmuramoyl-L-alanine amidase [Bariatricus massiliensis]|uniref:N-acetylmuramoyl-L-alanine amidase n=1 Tax=Bariatricus massiliensis TaxID=1745713 RepID=A0ABS8DGP6_9FIRM|nr:N-acetylmuramoyl-L-alanine amidase [Bariatricus massiliensis]MCB7304477.1 N-acetylmuramoyl-L-alanine amidase [Bariatricus massiliensis]MCB7375129.1 N-acetylmuramoyl-L-alanine amidase [Bariatricus massiliensis]MCB7387588.1 N-acetylmuramoyl-L-alanine amidase [Bariatricus massiliensis]MCB7411749.1 N-acetylmuramoyl-L-alanine amidase [Bariatricus massiliensis]MCQ5253885.1 N-acetylmuramoyl-L-alanine amidase [Bariatricus massiliensis]